MDALEFKDFWLSMYKTQQMKLKFSKLRENNKEAINLMINR